MSVLDVRNTDGEPVKAIKWCGHDSWDLVRTLSSCKAVKFAGIRLVNDGVSCDLVNSREHAEDLINALKKAIELGWVV